MKNNLKIKLSGTIIGKVWMPNCLGSTDFKKEYTLDNQPFTEKWNGLRSAVLDITNNGNFQSCAIKDMYITVSYSQKKTFITKTKEINKCKLIADCWVPDKMVEEFMMCESEIED
jgi:hypothetical protein